MPLKTRILLAVVIVSNAFGNVALGFGMRTVGDIATFSPVDLVASGAASLANPWVLLGVCLLVLYFAAHTVVLSSVDLSYVLLVTSVGYVLVAILSALLLDEPITVRRWIGTVLIGLGVGVVGSTPASTVRDAR